MDSDDENRHETVREFISTYEETLVRLINDELRGTTLHAELKAKEIIHMAALHNIADHRTKLTSTSYQTLARAASDCILEAKVLLRKLSQSNNEIEIDDAWREKIGAYLYHIKKIVTDAPIENEALREKILTRIYVLEKAVNQRRTSVEQFGTLLVDLTRVTGQSAKNLKPAIGLTDKIVKLIETVRGKEIKSLPAPDDLDTPDLIGEGEADTENTPPRD